jgi:hypothetical protein
MSRSVSDDDDVSRGRWIVFPGPQQAWAGRGCAACAYDGQGRGGPRAVGQGVAVRAQSCLVCENSILFALNQMQFTLHLQTVFLFLLYVLSLVRWRPVLLVFKHVIFLVIIWNAVEQLEALCQL